MLMSDLHSIVVPQHLQIFDQRPKIILDVILRLLWPDIKPDNIIYFHLLHNKGVIFKIVITIDHVLCVLLFMNEFIPSVLMAILIFLRSKANSEFRELMFHHCVISAGCLIIPTSCLCFSLCHHNNSDSFLFVN
jgi:hypothetical protein